MTPQIKMTEFSREDWNNQICDYIVWLFESDSEQSQRKNTIFSILMNYCALANFGACYSMPNFFRKVQQGRSMETTIK